MASEIRVNKIENRSGLGTVTFADTGVDIAGITTAVTLKATTGIVTTLTATTGIVTTLTTNTTRATTGIVTTLTATTGIVTTLTTNTLTANTTAKVGSGVTLSPDGDVFVTGVTTSSTVKVGAAVTITSDGIDASGIGITCSNINGNAIGGLKNLIMNGDFALDQRYGNVEQNPAVHGQYYADRWSIHKQQASKFQVHTTSEHLPSNQGYPYAFKCNVTNAVNPADTAGAYFLIEQPIEGRNVLGLKLGSSECQPITVQFWVRSSVTGTYSIGIRNSAFDRHVVKEYTISSANTYEKKVVTFPPVITSGTWLTNAGVGLRLDFSLGAGSNFRTSSLNVLGTGSQYASSNDVNWVNNANATFFLTGVQLEAGTEATEFERISHGEKLRMCQRYYQKIEGYSDLIMFGSGRANGVNNAQVAVPLTVPLRASPTLPSIAYSGWGISGAHTVTTSPTVQSFNNTDNQLNLDFGGLSGNLTNGRVATISSNGGSTLTMDAEI